MVVVNLFLPLLRGLNDLCERIDSARLQAFLLRTALLNTALLPTMNC